jgi:hypothetical protein
MSYTLTAEMSVTINHDIADTKICKRRQIRRELSASIRELKDGAVLKAGLAGNGRPCGGALQLRLSCQYVKSYQCPWVNRLELPTRKAFRVFFQGCQYRS